MDARGQLVQVLLHKAFYPVLMARRDGPERARLQHVQTVMRAEIERFQKYATVEDVVVNFKRELHSHPAKTVRSELKSLELPVLEDVRDEFERKAAELGVRA